MGLLILLAALVMGAPSPVATTQTGAGDVAPQVSQWWTQEGETWVKTDEAAQVRVEPLADRVEWTGGFTGRPLP